MVFPSQPLRWNTKSAFSSFCLTILELWFFYLKERVSKSNNWDLICCRNHNRPRNSICSNAGGFSANVHHPLKKQKNNYLWVSLFSSLWDERKEGVVVLFYIFAIFFWSLAKVSFVESDLLYLYYNLFIYFSFFFFNDYCFPLCILIVLNTPTKRNLHLIYISAKLYVKHLRKETRI